MRRRLLLSCIGMAGLCLSAPAFAASHCALAPERAGVVLEYRGECRNGLVHGVADVMIELPPAADGRARRAREFGWFQRGLPQGVHVITLPDPKDQAPGFALLMSFDAAGRENWSFGLAAAYWPKSGTLLSSGPWSDVDDKARQAGIDYFAPKRADGSSYGEGSTMIADVLNQAVEFSMVAGVQSVTPATLRHFLASISIRQPLAGVSTGFPVETTLADTDEQPPATLAAESTRGTDATLRPGEILVRTREGCGMITQLADEKYRQTIIDTNQRKSWLGECVDGMVLGPGTMLVRTTIGSNSEERTSLIQRQWYFNGRPIGESTTTSFSSGSYQGGTTESFTWADTSFSRSRSVTDTPVAQAQGNNPPTVMAYSPQRKVIYTLLRSANGWPAECGPDGSACLQERLLGSIPSTLNYYRCKKNDCGALWAEKVAPVLAAHEAFKAGHAAEVESARRSVAGVLAPLLTAQKIASRDAEVTRIIRDAEGVHAAERAQAAAAAEQARVAAARAKAAEDAAKAESRKKFWNNVLSGATALAGAAATYAEARSGGASKDDARMATLENLAGGGSGGESSSAIDEAIRRSALSDKPCLREVNLRNESAPNPAVRLEYPQGISPPIKYLRDELRTFDSRSMRFVRNPNGVSNVRKAFFDFSGKTMMQRRIDEHWFDEIGIKNCLQGNKGITRQECQYYGYGRQLEQCQDYFKYFFITGKIDKLPRVWPEAIYSEADLREGETLRDEVLGRN